MASNKEVVLTQEGYDDLYKEMRYLIDVQQPENLKKLNAARDMGDLSENADYSAAKDEQSQIEGRIKEIEKILNNAKVVQVNKKDKSVGMGKTVLFKNLSNGKEIKVLIVSTEEAAPLNNDGAMKISTDSPIGSALLGHKVGDVVTVKANRTYDIEIVEVDVK